MSYITSIPPASALAESVAEAVAEWRKAYDRTLRLRADDRTARDELRAAKARDERELREAVLEGKPPAPAEKTHTAKAEARLAAILQAIPVAREEHRRRSVDLVLALREEEARSKLVAFISDAVAPALEGYLAALDAVTESVRTAEAALSEALAAVPFVEGVDRGLSSIGVSPLPLPSINVEPARTAAEKLAARAEALHERTIPDQRVVLVDGRRLTLVPSVIEHLLAEGDHTIEYIDGHPAPEEIG